MSKFYLPVRESELLDWALDFSALTSAAPADFGLSLEQGAMIAAAVGAFDTAYETAKNRDTRTPVAIESKNTAKREMIRVVRSMVRLIQAWPEITDAKRSMLGITVPDPTPTSVPVPAMPPVLTVVAVMGRVIKVNLRGREDDGSVSDRRGRPAGVRGASVYFAAGEDYPQDISGWSFKGSVSATTFTVSIPDSVPAGSKVFLTAQWFNGKSQTGPACEPVETSVARGLNQAA